MIKKIKSFDDFNNKDMIFYVGANHRKVWFMCYEDSDIDTYSMIDYKYAFVYVKNKTLEIATSFKDMLCEFQFGVRVFDIIEKDGELYYKEKKAF